MAKAGWVMVLAALMLGGPAAAQVVKTASGPVQGVTAGGIASFKGIPFAAPPVGPLRWKPPQPAAKWTAPLDASKVGFACMQARTLFPEDKVQSEDCLTLNVWAPAGAKKLPVMVWIYGGGFSSGSTRAPLYDGTTFAKRGVVLVSVNYRVGRFGFFGHPALSAEGGPVVNYGIMDQIAGLKWVQRNIARFGGDPANVTIFGESAGGISVNALMATPAAKGLFAKAISESGFGRTVGVSLAGAEAMGVAFAEAQGVKGDAAALRAIPAETVMKAAQPPAPGGRQPGGAPGGQPWPAIDGVLFKEQVEATFAAGRQAKVPYLAGGNSYEASLFAFVRANPQAAFDSTGEAAKAQALYVTGGRDAGLGALDMVTDLQVTEPARHMGRQVARAGKPAWLYYFSYLPPAARATAPGAAHGAELAYVFGALPATAAPDGKAVSEAMQSAWVAFARTGSPGWTPIGPSGGDFMEYGVEGAVVRPDFMQAKLDFLEGLSKR